MQEDDLRIRETDWATRSDDAERAEDDFPKLAPAIVGVLAGFDSDHSPLVEFEGAPLGEPIAARTTVPLCFEQIGSEATLVFEGGDPRCPIVTGIILPNGVQSSIAVDSAPLDLGDVLSVETDGERVCLTARKQLELRCGQATLVLTRSGKILLRGSYISSRATGVHRVKGASVQIN